MSFITILAIALWFRVCSLENLPGVNGDEAWYGVQAFQISAGRPFALRTPTGLPLNLFFTGMEVPLILAFRPSFWILRAPAVVSGILAIPLIFWLGSRILDRLTALIAMLLLAVLPSAIGYSRFGWDASQTPLCSLLALYFAFRGKSLAMLICFAFCVLVHASNIFLFPVLLSPYLVALWSAEKEPIKRRRILAMTAGLGLLALVLLAMLHSSLGGSFLASRAVPENWLRFLGHFGRLISGITFYEFVVGPISPRIRALFDGAFWSLFVGLIALGGPRLIRDRCWDRLALIAGLALGALGLYLVVGPDVIRPHRERYGMYLLVPTILVFACLIAAMIPHQDGARAEGVRGAAFVAVLLGGLALLFSFKIHYFDALRTTGGESHIAFRTAAVEPKQQALRLILDDLARRTPPAARGADDVHPPGHPIEQGGRAGWSIQPIIAENWWLYWPIRFLACRQPGVDVIPFEEDPSFLDLERPAGRASAMTILASGGYAVAFVGGGFEQMVTSSIPADRLERWDVPDYGGRKLISVFRVESR